MDKELLENILNKIFKDKQEVLLIGKENKIYIDSKGEPVFLENISLPGLLIISYEQNNPTSARILGEPKKYTHYNLGQEMRIHESHGFAIVYKEIVAVDFLREMNL
ncbi:MAG: hypothetical protein AABX39_03655 [Nanoarchaeota archaeon]